MTTTANLQLSAATKLQAPASSQGGQRHPDYRAITRAIRALPVGSAFEADWAYLQLARGLLPQTYRGLLDRWQAWFIHIDPAAPFPELTKTAHPSPRAGMHLGPFPDKHSAARYIELLQDAFDLCRYHHILVQAPHASACAYKEMGRCPAPCDGSVSMDSYRLQATAAAKFAGTPIEQWTSDTQRAMRSASDRLEFETAQRCRQLLDRTKSAIRPEFRLVDQLERFRFAALMPSERVGWTRLFVILGGWIAPLMDVAIDGAAIEPIRRAIDEFMTRQAPDFSEAGVENIGMVCWHLFRGPQRQRPGALREAEQSRGRLNQGRRGGEATRRTSRRHRGGEFLRIPDQLSDSALMRAQDLIHRDAQVDQITERDMLEP